MSTFTTKLLADGQLATTKGTLYSLPASTRTIVKTITLVNTSGGSVTANLYLNLSGTSRRIIPQNCTIPGNGLLIFDDNLTMSGSTAQTGSIEGDASVATTVDYTINGVEEA